MKREAELLLAAICAHPDDDVPRLIYADHWEENGESAYAAFIRQQIASSRLPPWHRTNILTRWHFHGREHTSPFRRHLPDLTGTPAVWGKNPWRRGLAGCLSLPSLAMWEEVEARLWQRAPIEELRLGAAWTYDQLRRWAASPLLAGVRSLILDCNPIDPLRAIRTTSQANRLRSLRFLRSSGAGLTVALEEFLQSPIGRQITELHFHVGDPAYVPYLLDVLALAPPLQALTLDNVGLQFHHLRQLLSLPALQTVESLDLSRNPLGSAAMSVLLAHWPPSLQVLKLERIASGVSPMEGTRQSDEIPNSPVSRPLALLDISQNTFLTMDFLAFLQHSLLEKLQSLRMRHCFRVLDAVPLWRFRFWAQLVELDLRDNVEDTVSPLCRRQCLPPASLAALVLTGAHLSARRCRQLRRKFRGSLILT
ncbi:MAG: TIGR02996 domain-containing protein [Thermogemmata sp.]|uniref:TIGR02996 domain-containing protein n=1 Tax=Thermogemmata fonticola TaxID=2755323 RepID=A0A7V9AAE3_9BACT|nr:TIGR02996 domain-containing protein [Thermogemmata fonticola]MBA2224814.1 TIGR02996 domain-containing protein [Thermogemmata fonticola]MCX8140238.1 TIGR02996 domain-containing protein [Gemmataceae bacterium]GIW84628.1 MAG: hypothetical protein KatS3mg107_0288 [Gemmataceae bacterium]